MAGGLLESLDRDGLLEYVRSLLWQYRLVDAFWFINAEKEFGLAAAETLNERVWGKVAELSARDIVRRFGPFGAGLEAFRKAYSLFPWSMLVDYRLEERDDGLHLTVRQCPAQEGRKRHGQGEYSCKAMHLAEFEGFLKIAAPGVRVECLFAPPDPHPDDCHCAWRFFEASGQAGEEPGA